MSTAVKKSAVKKAKAPKAASHPTYFEMIKDAILGLKEKTGSSPHAIAKFIEEKHKAVLHPNFRKALSIQLKHSVAKGNLVKVKASFKLSEAAKKVAKPKVVKKPVAKAASKKVVAVKKKKPVAATTKKVVVVKKVEKVVKAKAKAKVEVVKKRKAPVVKAKAPKSIKSPAAKRAKRASAKA